MVASSSDSVVAKHLERHGSASINTITRPKANHENVIACAFILKSSLDHFSRSRVFDGKRASTETHYLPSIIKFERQSLCATVNDSSRFIIKSHQVRSKLCIHLPICSPRNSNCAPAFFSFQALG